MEALQKLFTHELEDLYDAEQQILKALPNMIDGSTSPELQDALEEHRAATEGQVQRLDRIFRQLGEKREGRKCKGMAGLIAEGEDILKEDFEDATMDAGIIGAAQRVEHYEIAAYGTARTLAQFLGHDDVAELLEQTLDEEKEADKLLTQIAQSGVNTEEDEEERRGNGGRAKSAPRAKARTTTQRARKPKSKAGR